MTTRRTTLIAGMVVATALCMAAQACATKVVVEAEHYYGIKPSMQKAPSQVASNRGYVHIPLDHPHRAEEGNPRDTGYAYYRVKIPATGTYNFWGRVQWYDRYGNSFFLKIDSHPAMVFGNGVPYQRWHWARGVRLNLRAGVHTFRIQNREDGAKLDQFLLTTDTRYVPTRAEKETSEYVIRPPKDNGEDD